MHVAELLGELFVDSLNNPDAIDTRRLQALTALSRVLLKAVGTPPTFLVHSDRREPSPAAGHLLRVYPPLAPEVEALLAAEPPVDPGTPPPPPAGSPVEEIRTIDAGDGAAWNAAAVFLPAREPSIPCTAPPPLAHRRLIDVHASLAELASVGLPLNHVAAADPLLPPSVEALRAAAPPVALAADPDPVTPDPEPLNTRSPGRLVPEQVPNRTRTGPSPIDQCCYRLLASLALRLPVNPALATLDPSANPPTAPAPPDADAPHSPERRPPNPRTHEHAHPRTPEPPDA